MREITFLICSSERETVIFFISKDLAKNFYFNFIYDEILKQSIILSILLHCIISSPFVYF